MNLLLMVLIMLFCSTIASYYWSQLDFIRETYELYRSHQRIQLALAALRDYGIGWFLKNFSEMDEVLLGNNSGHEIYYKEWPFFKRSDYYQDFYQARLRFSRIDNISEEAVDRVYKLTCLLYKDSVQIDECACVITYKQKKREFLFTYL